MSFVIKALTREQYEAIMAEASEPSDGYARVSPELMAKLDKLKRYEEREPLVTDLIECAFDNDHTATHKAAERVRDFEPKLPVNKANMDRMIRELIGEADYDLGKSLDPKTAEEPESIPERMEEFRRIVEKHLK